MLNISFQITLDAVRTKQKTVTRRLAWLKLKPGQLLQPVEKTMGIRKGEHPVRVGGPIRVLTVRREALGRLLEDPDYGRVEVDREGFPGLTVDEFVRHFCEKIRCGPDVIVTRVEFEYVEEDKGE